jgi:hypothetical protein
MTLSEWNSDEEFNALLQMYNNWVPNGDSANRLYCLPSVVLQPDKPVLCGSNAFRECLRYCSPTPKVLTPLKTVDDNKKLEKFDWVGCWGAGRQVWIGHLFEIDDTESEADIIWLDPIPNDASHYQVFSKEPKSIALSYIFVTGLPVELAMHGTNSTYNNEDLRFHLKKHLGVEIFKCKPHNTLQAIKHLLFQSSCHTLVLRHWPSMCRHKLTVFK